MPTALFTPIKVGSSLLRHRIVLYYQQRASEGGLLVAEATFIAEDAGVYPSAPGIYNDKQIEAWKNVTKAVHDKGGSIYLQLWHVGRATVSAWIPGSKLPVSASAIAINGKNTAGMDYEVPRVLAVEEISQITQTYADAAKNAISAGFDGVEIHGANGYLIDQFINTSSNIRTDQYGGSIENRTRFALEVIEGVSKAIGEDRTAIRLSPWSGFQDMKDDTPYETWGYLVSQLQEKHPNLAYLHFIEPRDDNITTMFPEIDRTEIIENDTIEPFHKAWKGPFISAGGYTTTPKRAFETTERLENTLVAFGRSFIANPDLPLRLKNDSPLNKYNRATFYSSGNAGYTDYPFYNPDTANDIKN
ncbi:hypothetical protein J3Q64DRAFT_1814857 [Phycomyces blakesleeanus]|uniref:NADH:flavin oxidoreductase/NADH oxidase N-terminal domain-containing protein n=1 Tax=Phycomyces blakesleeanus TaxID=4837 RepID=A0ABR3AX92_PHYBL